MKYDLEEIVERTTNRSRDIILRPIFIPNTLVKELYNLVSKVPQYWERAVYNVILPSYTVALDKITRDAPVDDLRGTIERLVKISENLTEGLKADILRWIDKTDRWHRQRWEEVVKSGTGVELKPLLDLSVDDQTIQAMLERTTNLVKGLNEATRVNLSERVWKNFLEKAPRKELGKDLSEALRTSRSRANLIARDQANKVSAELNMHRQADAGIEEFIWETAQDDRVREEHAALQGQKFKWTEPPSIGLPGTPINCRCTGRAFLDL